MEVLIREREKRDLAGVARVRIDTWREAYRGIVPDEFLAGLDYAAETARLEQRARETRELANFFFLVAEDENQRIVGFAVGGPARESPPEYPGELYALYVLPEYQGKGIGRQMADEIFTSLRAAGLEPVIIWALKENRKAGAFYQRLGGRPVAEKTIEIGGKILTEVGFGIKPE